MNQIPEIHLCIQQPAGYLHSLGLVDPARYFRYQFRRLGARVTIAKNRLRHDAVNFVFGAHLGFDASLRERHACVFVNLEQLGQGGAQVSDDYLKLLATSAVVDYNPQNRAAYAAQPDDVPVVPLLYAPYLKPAQSVALEDRPIDLLFFGSMNERRRAWLDRIEAMGHTVTTFDAPLYGAERDQFIRQAKSVVNAHFYESSRFEQARVAHCLSLGTPVIAERTAQTQPHPAFEHCVLWLQGEELEQFFAQDFATPAYFDLARQAVESFGRTDPLEAYAQLLAFAKGFAQVHHERRPAEPWRPKMIQVGSGAAYRAGWLNVDSDESAQPDLLMDFAQPLTLPCDIVLGTLGPVRLAPDSVTAICIQAEPMSGERLRQLLANGLELLEPAGLLQLDIHDAWSVAASRALPTGQPVGHREWEALTQRFWELGRLTDRYVVHAVSHLGGDLQACPPEQAAVTRVVLRKTETSLRESNAAQAMQAMLWLPDDEVDGDIVVDGQPGVAPSARVAEPAVAALPAARPFVAPAAAPAAAQPPAHAPTAVRTCWERQLANVD